jgi:hypothetical protein
MKRIGSSSDGKPYKSSYELTCGCIVDKYDANAAKSTVKEDYCSICTDKKYHELLSRLGLSLVEKTNKDIQRYKVNACKHILTLRRVSLSLRKEFSCPECKSLQLREIYDVRGVELIEESSPKPFHKMYRFKDCNHVQSIDPCLIVRNTFRCQQCYDNELSAQATASGFEYIGDATRDCKNSYDYRKYKRVECGHVRDIGVANVRNGIVGCVVCDEIRFNKEASGSGFELIGQSQDGKGHKRLYKYNSCGHYINVTPAALRRRSGLCMECREISWAETAKSKGLELVADDVNNVGYKFYKLQCGHTHSFRITHVNYGYFKCPTCFVGYKQLESFAYLILIESPDKSFLKFGFGKQPEFRKNSYGLIKGFTKKVIATKGFNTGKEAQEFEQGIHAKYKINVLCKIEQKKIMKTSGYTECYPLSLMDDLIKELDGD